MPFRAIRSPLDLLLVYLTPSDHQVGQRLSLSTIDKRLRDLPLRPVLRLLAITAHRTDTSIQDRSQRLELAQALLRPGPMRQRAETFLRSHSAEGYAVTSPQVVLALAERALLSCPDVRSAITDEELGYRLGELLLGLGDHLARRGSSRDELMLELVRLGLFYRLHGVTEWHRVAYELYLDVLPSLASDHEFMDVDELLASTIGMDLRTYWLISAAISVVMLGDRRLHVFPMAIGAVDSSVTDRWAAAQSQRIEDARLRAEQDLASKSPWALAAFFTKPILVGVGDDGDYPVRSQLVAVKATVPGMYYTVAELVRAADGDTLQWSRFFGRAVEEWGRRVLRRSLPEESLTFPDIRDVSGRDPKACDAVIADEDVIALDFVHRMLLLATQTTGTPIDLEKDLTYAVVEKIEQIDATLTGVVNGARHIYPVVVTSGPLPMSPILRSRLRELVANLNVRIIGVDQRCRDVAVLEMHELATLLEVVNFNQTSAGAVLEEWLSSELGGVNFRDWMAIQEQFERPPIGEFGLEAWERAVQTTLFQDDQGS